MKKDVKRLLKRGYKLDGLDSVLRILISGRPLPPKYRDHPLTGKWFGCRECHIADDWLLIYRINQNQLILTASRTGTHSDFRW
jgi:mRNA interferase YafQ